MTTLVMAHGGHDSNERKLKVPAGMQIDFYAEFDENMLFMNGLAVLARGDAGTPSQSYAAGDELPNYYYTALSDEQLGWYLQLDRSGIPTWFVGNDLPDNTYLCTDYDDCDAWGANDGSGNHSCDGVLGKAHAAGEAHLAIFACRGAFAGPGTSSKTIHNADGTLDQDYYDEMRAEIDRIWVLPKAELEKTWDAYPENTKVALNTSGMSDWSSAYGARTLLRGQGLETYAAYYPSLSDGAKALLEADPETAGKSYIGQWVGFIVADPAAALTAWNGLNDTNRAALLADPGIAAWATGATGGATAGPVATAAPAPADATAADGTNELFVKGLAEKIQAPWAVGGGIVQLGPGHQGADWVRAQPDFREGTFEVKRATIGAGRLAFHDVPPVHQDTITAAVGRFSDKAVRFE
jgi:hypothetical protein